VQPDSVLIHLEYISEDRDISIQKIESLSAKLRQNRRGQDAKDALASGNYSQVISVGFSSFNAKYADSFSYVG
jgi:hypothetical protein